MAPRPETPQPALSAAEIASRLGACGIPADPARTPDQPRSISALLGRLGRLVDRVSPADPPAPGTREGF